MRLWLTTLVMVALAGDGIPLRSEPGGTPCLAETGTLAPSRNLYCIELEAVPDLDGATGSFELNRAPSPFGVNVTRDGNQVYAPILRISGLPAPDRFSPRARFWVAWIATPQLYPVRKLGVVGNGTHPLPSIDWPKFLILVTAEIASDGAEPTGRAALRGFSPSWRMQPPDLSQFLYGAVPLGPDVSVSRRPGDSAHAAHAPPAASGTATWIHPPMPPGLGMMPAEMQLPPPATDPFLPSADRTEAVPPVRSREGVELRDGDTLVLRAGPVRQTVRGHRYIGYAYNGQVPGPLLRVRQGSRIVVRYRNAIEWPTTIHWHGIRVENGSDGAEGVTQEPVLPGGVFDYTLQFPDAGLFWYHPHGRDDLLRDLGLFGSILVTPNRLEPGPAHREEILMLDDMEVAPEGPMPYGLQRATHALMGRMGNVLLINQRTDWSLEVGAGEVVRFLLTNVSNARAFNLSFGGAPIKLLGTDLGPYEREEWVESVVIGPAERYLVEVRFDRTGTAAIENRVLAIDHVFGRFFAQVDTLGTVRVRASPAAGRPDPQWQRLRQHDAVIGEIGRLRKEFDRPPDYSLVIRMEAPGLPFTVARFLAFDSVYFHPVEWSGTMPMMNWNATTAEVRWLLEEPATGRRNMDIRWSFRRGEVVKVRIANLRETLHGMQHPIHFHGQRFLVLAQNGVPNTNLAWKDTFLLPAGGTADVLLELSNPGEWMAHCHISEHLESGMMFTYSVR